MIKRLINHKSIRGHCLWAGASLNEIILQHEMVKMSMLELLTCKIYRFTPGFIRSRSVYTLLWLMMVLMWILWWKVITIKFGFWQFCNTASEQRARGISLDVSLYTPEQSISLFWPYCKAEAKRWQTRHHHGRLQHNTLQTHADSCS